jgi:hypothetical protein
LEKAAIAYEALDSACAPLSAHCPRPRVLFTKTYGRVLAPGLSALNPSLPPDLIRRSDLSTAWRHFGRALDSFKQQQLVAA